ncbi:uncharacterized protein LOC110684482 [Chenopodium quinoa]|uniref:uncharacterized protein LOC110684482 n=1 Tax=Chenopodium quinoa TaxID=63459 RepID=UPI000B798840|nr:uncharacterized protein LOC110684482 [Chenopodium quinoa]
MNLSFSIVMLCMIIVRGVNSDNRMEFGSVKLKQIRAISSKNLDQKPQEIRTLKPRKIDCFRPKIPHFEQKINSNAFRNDRFDPQSYVQSKCSLNEKVPLLAQSNPSGAERLPPGIVASKSDLYLRRLWGLPSEDLKTKPKYLVTFTVGLDMKENIDKAVKKFSDNFTILLFHYDGKTTEWDQFEWSKRSIHVSARKQTKWWYAKRFLHPDIVAPYDYIFIRDEDLGVDNFDSGKLALFLHHIL